MGVPVLTLKGDRFLSRQGEMIVSRGGLPDWVAEDRDEYVNKAIAYASDIQRLASIRRNLRENLTKSPLLDAPRFAANFEKALWDMWNTWLEQATPL